MTLLEQKRNLKGNRKKENEYRIIKKRSADSSQEG